MQKKSKSVFLRLFSYLLRYKFRIASGIALSFVVSFSNLFSLSAFVPIFNAMGETGPVKIFQFTEKENDLYAAYARGETLAPEDYLAAFVVRAKKWANRKVEGKSAGELIFLLTGIIVPVYLLKLLSLTGTIYFIGTAGYLAVRDMRMDLYASINRIGLDYFHKEQTGMVMSRVINDVELIGKSLSMEFNESINNIIYIITHLALLAFISFKFLIVMIVVVPLLMSPVNKFSRNIRKASRLMQEKLSFLGGHVQEIISGIRVIRAFSMEDFEKKRFKAINHGLYENTFKQHFYHQVGPALTEFVGTIILIFFISWGAYEISRGMESGMTKGLFFAFFFTLLFLMRPMKQISIALNLYSAASAAGERVFEMIDMKAGVDEPVNPEPMQEFNAEIAFSKVSFSYPGTDRNALENITLEVKKGQTVSFVGSSGAGKSTLMDLFLRFYDVSDGSIRIDGRDIRSMSLKDLRRSVGFVTQNIFLFNSTIGDNIAYGRSDISMEKIEEAARAANAHDFISSLPEGYNTPVGERGVMLSGGQKQRLAIARALLLDPPILVFDEATSSLDNESEKLVQEAIERLLKGRTVFVIAHRLSTVYKSDKIYVLDRGRIAENGNHSELLEKGGIYRKLYEMQFAENEES